MPCFLEGDLFYRKLWLFVEGLKLLITESEIKEDLILEVCDNTFYFFICDQLKWELHQQISWLQEIEIRLGFFEIVSGDPITFK